MTASEGPGTSRRLSRSRPWLAALLVVGLVLLLAAPVVWQLARPDPDTGGLLPPAWTGLRITEPDHGGVLGHLGDRQIGAWTPYGTSFVLGGSATVAGRTDAAFWVHHGDAGWSLVPDPDGVLANAQVGDVTSAGDRLVSIGFVNVGGSHTRTVFWTSSDGATWTRHGGLPDLDDYGGVVVAGRHAFLIAGEVSGPLGATTVMARSADGARWEMVSVDAFSGAEIRGVVPFGEGFVAMAVDRDEAASGDTAPPGRTWWSVDGAGWVDTTPPAAFGFDGLYAGATGMLLRGQEECDAEAACGGAVTWHSADGRSWRRLGDLPVTPRFASDGERIVSFDRASMSLSWSYDGIDWRPLATLPPVDDVLGAMLVGPGGLLFGRVVEGGTFLQNQGVEGWIWYLPSIISTED